MKFKDTLKAGDFLVAKTGEIMQVNNIGETFQFQMYHPKTKERSDYCLEGDSDQLEAWAKEAGVKIVSREEALK